MPRVDATFPTLRARHIADARVALGRLFEAQERDVKARLGAGASALLTASWDERLAEVILDRSRLTAGEFARRVARVFGEEFDVTRMDAWLATNADRVAQLINDATRERLDGADEQRVDEVMTNLQDGGAARHAATVVAATANFGVHDAARNVGGGAKQWNVTSGNPRSAHAAMNGEMAALDSAFSNGLMWPGDSAGDASQTANCMCGLTIL